MKKTNLVLKSFLQALATFVYVLVVVTIMSNGEKIFGKGDGPLTGVMVMMLFIVSASVCGILVLAKPIMLYLDNQKKEALKLLYSTVGWLALFTIIIFVAAALMR